MSGLIRAPHPTKLAFQRHNPARAQDGWYTGGTRIIVEKSSMCYTVTALVLSTLRADAPQWCEEDPFYS